MNHFRELAATALAISVWAAAEEAPEPLPLAAKAAKHQLDITVAGKLFTSYRFAPTLKKPYFWPVIGPKSGKSVTIESMTNHHPHHNSIWIGCDRINGQNFWGPHGKIETGQITSTGPKLVQDKGEAVVFTDECTWQKPGAEPVLRDTRQVTIRAPSADLRLIDFEITLHMLTDLSVLRTNHSMFSVRVVPELSVTSGGTLVNAEGNKGEKATFGVASPWCDYYGTRDKITEGVALFEHPGNRWYPCQWFTRDYGFMSPTPMFWPPDGKGHHFAKDEKLTLRYRVVVHVGDVNAANIAGLFREYAPNADLVMVQRAAGPLKTYQFGQSRDPLLKMSSLIRKADRSPELRNTIEECLTALLKTDATFDCKQFVCQKLSEIGTERSVPVLAKLLRDKKLFNTARFALERIDSPQVDPVFRAALAEFSGDAKIGIINSMGTCRDRGAIPDLAKLASGKDSQLASAAISALGNISGPEAAKALAGLTVPDGLKTLKADALVRCADRMEPGAASAIYRQLVTVGNPTAIRIAALEGVVRTERGKALPTLVDFLKSSDPLRQEAAAKFAVAIPGSAATKALTAQLPSLPPRVKVVLLTTLRTRGDKSGVAAVAECAKDSDESARAAALLALGALGDARHVGMLANAAASGGIAGKAAVEGLLVLTGQGVDPAIVKGIKEGAPAVRTVLLRSLVARDYDAVIPVLLVSAKDDDADVHKTACRALGAVAGQKELAPMVALLLSTKKPTARRELEQAIGSVAGRVNDADACAGPLAAALAKADDGAKASLVAILRRVGGAKSLAAIQSQLTSDSPVVKKAAIQALADWPDPSPMDQLTEIAKSDSNEVHRVLALRGVIKQVVMPANRSVEATAQLLTEAMELAEHAPEKRAVLAVLPTYPCDGALALAESCLKDKEVAAEAELALKQLRRTEGPKFDFQQKGAPVMEGFLEVTQSTLYTDQRGYGWLKPLYAARDRGKGTPLTRDFVFDAQPRTFRLRLANGLRVVTVFLGDMTTGHDNMEVRAEGEVKLRKITNKAGEVKELFFDVKLEDGLLDIEFRNGGGRNPHWTCAGLMVGK